MTLRTLSALAIVGLFLGTMAMACAAKPNDPSIEDLSTFRWKHRVLLIQSSAETVEFLAQLKANEAGITDRHLLWFLKDGERIQTNHARKLGPRFGVTTFTTKSSVVLIGKDGDTKLRAEKLNLEQIFALIDTMPMRKAEMED